MSERARTHIALPAEDGHRHDYDALVDATLARIGAGGCPDCGHELLPQLIRVIGKVAAGDFSEKPELPVDDHPMGMLAAGLRFLVEDLQTAALHEEGQRANLSSLRRNIINTAAEGLTAPLTPLLLQIHLLRRRLGENADPELQRPIDVLSRNVLRLERAVRTCVDLSRTENGIAPNAFRAVRIDELVQSAIADLEDQATRHHLLFDITSDDAVTAHGDPRYLEQLVWHLLANAVEASPTGGRVQITLTRADDAVRLTVSDEGPGVPPGQEEAVFAPFSRLHRERRGGLGLGLTLAQRVAILHGGHVWYDANPDGAGSRFTCILPVGPLPA